MNMGTLRNEAQTSGALADKVAIVTGSSSGIGRAIAVAFAKEGACVVCADLESISRQPQEQSEGTTLELIGKSGGRATFQQTDVGKPDQMKSLIETAVQEYGRLDIMVNNAGIALEAKRPALCHETDEKVYDMTMLINSKSVFMGCKFALAQMMKQEPATDGSRGKIINLSSIYGLVGGSMNSSYCMAKGAVAQLTRSIALDYGKHRINCNAISPGHISTAIWNETRTFMMDESALMAQYPMGHTGEPKDVAEAAVFLASDRSKYVTGICLPVDGGYTCH